MTEDRYLTVAEFAEAAHFTKQGIYKRMKGDLAAYVVKRGKQAYISEAALVLFNGPISQIPASQASVAESAPNTTATTAATTAQSAESQTTAIRYLMDQIREKDRLLTEQRERLANCVEREKQLQEQLRQQQEHSQGLADKIAEILERQTQLQQNYQILLSKMIEVPALPPTQPEKEPVESVERNDHDEHQETIIEQHQKLTIESTPEESMPEEVVAEPPPKKSFWARLFGG